MSFVRKMHIETCSVCLWMFVIILFWTVLTWRCWVKKIPHSCVGWTGTELSCPELSSCKRRPLDCRSPSGRRARGKRLRRHAAPPGGGRPGRGCKAPADQRRRGGRQEQRSPGASEAGRSRNPVSNLGHLKKVFGIEILAKMFAFSANVWQSCGFPPLNMRQMLGSMITCSVGIICFAPDGPLQEMQNTDGKLWMFSFWRRGLVYFQILGHFPPKKAGIHDHNVTYHVRIALL